MTKTNFESQYIYHVEYNTIKIESTQVYSEKEMTRPEIEDYISDMYNNIKEINIRSISTSQINLNSIFTDTFGEVENNDLHFSYESMYESFRVFCGGVKVVEINFSSVPKEINLKIEYKNGEYEWIQIDEGSVIVYNNKEEYQKAFVREFLKENDINKDILKEI